jgi:hypothetical protein
MLVHPDKSPDTLPSIGVSPLTSRDPLATSLLRSAMTIYTTSSHRHLGFDKDSTYGRKIEQDPTAITTAIHTFPFIRHKQTPLDQPLILPFLLEHALLLVSFSAL